MTWAASVDVAHSTDRAADALKCELPEYTESDSAGSDSFHINRARPAAASAVNDLGGTGVGRDVVLTLRPDRHTGNPVSIDVADTGHCSTDETTLARRLDLDPSGVGVPERASGRLPGSTSSLLGIAEAIDPEEAGSLSVVATQQYFGCPACGKAPATQANAALREGAGSALTRTDVSRASGEEHGQALRQRCL